MPDYVLPRISAADLAVMKGLGVNPLRAAILRYLALHPEGALSGEIARELDVKGRLVWTYLKVLMEDGMVVADDAGPGRPATWRRYRLDRDALDAALTSYREYLDGGTKEE